MGKRKKSSRKPMGPVKREPLATTFRCVFCSNETSVSVKIDKKAGVGNLACKSCGQSFQTGINYLTQPVDVYADWVDACDAVAKDEPTASNMGAAHAMARSRPVAAASAREVDTEPEEEMMTTEDRNFIDDEDDDAEADFADDD